MSTDDLRHLLDDELAHLPAQPLTLGSVQRRARTVRRRRTALATGAVAAVAAVLVPLAVVAGGALSRADDLDPVSPSSPAVTVATDGAGTDDAAAVTGPAWSDGTTIHAADGTVVEVDVDATSGFSFVPLGDRFLAGSYGNGTGLVLTLVEADGTVVDTFEGTEYAVGDGQGRTAGWTVGRGADRSVAVLGAGESDPTLLPLTGLPDSAGPPELLTVRGGGCTEEAADEGDGCQAVVLTNERSGGSRAWVVTPDEAPRELVPDVFFSVTGVSPDGTLVAGTTEVDERAMSTCSAVVDAATGTALWETCEVGYLRFSPDGAHVLATDPWRDGLGQNSWTVLDARTGAQVQRYEGLQTTQAWAGPDQVVALVGDSATNAGAVQVWTLGEEEPEVLAEDPRQLMRFSLALPGA
ncbi:hypothetical protein [Nocardioides bruguierae]|uniref:hypothetical protein n=1 Tax=Nocardioides bruguierae TaxID=2945102 RepID=UPI0020220D82|nr:hypothetical protein [Nocardioides bruguierae]MCL8025133.1 hypothetical protein [Nocardioides bruguierae]